MSLAFNVIATQSGAIYSPLSNCVSFWCAEIKEANGMKLIYWELNCFLFSIYYPQFWVLFFFFLKWFRLILHLRWSFNSNINIQQRNVNGCSIINNSINCAINIPTRWDPTQNTIYQKNSTHMIQSKPPKNTVEVSCFFCDFIFLSLSHSLLYKYHARLP